MSKMSTSGEAPMEDTQPSDDSVQVGSTTNQQSNTTRALPILHALNKSS